MTMWKYTSKPLKTAYLSGPISGHKDQNEPLFRRAEGLLLEWGYNQVVVPHDIDPWVHSGPCPEGYAAGQAEHSSACYLRTDLYHMLSYAQDVWVLPNSENSKGAQLEIHVAKMCGLPVYHFNWKYIGNCTCRGQDGDCIDDDTQWELVKLIG